MDNGSLFDLIKKETEETFNQLPLLRKLKIMGDIACGLYDIHKKNFIHADLKPGF
jgi:serine/threonine protein kinase